MALESIRDQNIPKLVEYIKQNGLYTREDGRYVFLENYAKQHGFDLIEEIAKHDINISIPVLKTKEKTHETLLEYVCRNKTDDMTDKLRMLFDCGINVNYYVHKSPLEHILYSQKIYGGTRRNCVKYLLDKGATININCVIMALLGNSTESDYYKNVIVGSTPEYDNDMDYFDLVSKWLDENATQLQKNNTKTKNHSVMSLAIYSKNQCFMQLLLSHGFTLTDADISMLADKLKKTGLI